MRVIIFFLLMKNTIQYIYIYTNSPFFRGQKMSPTLCGVHSETFILKVKKICNRTDKQTNNKQTNEIIFTRIMSKKHYHNNLSYVTNDAYVFFLFFFFPFFFFFFAVQRSLAGEFVPYSFSLEGIQI